jgi:hypothetical protein
MSKKTTSKPVVTEQRTCFGIAWFTDEADAKAMAASNREKGVTVNGGFMHGSPCGRAPGFDYDDKEHGRLYACLY